MTTAATVDHQLIHDSFCQWHADQGALDAQLADSVAALEAYQSHLDAWQRDLAAEREELGKLRAAWNRDQELSGSHGEQVETLELELNDARHKITSLTTALLTRTEELRELDRLRVQTDHQLIEARTREKELAAALEAHRNTVPTSRPTNQPSLQPRQQNQRDERSTAAGPPTAANGQAPNTQPPNGRPAAEPAPSSNAVLGSVMEQFGKLRQQRSAGRQNNPKPR